MFSTVEMALQHDALERHVFARASLCNQLKRTRHSLEFLSVLDLLAIVFIVGLRKHFITSYLEKKVINSRMDSMSSCMVRMMIAS